MRFTDAVRIGLYKAGWRAKKKRLTFYYRRDGGKRKKVSGFFNGLWHNPKFGFIIELKRCHWRGRYWGRLGMRFCTKYIEWTDEQAASAFQEAIRAARPKLEAGGSSHKTYDI